MQLAAVTLELCHHHSQQLFKIIWPFYSIFFYLYKTFQTIIFPENHNYTPISKLLKLPLFKV